MWKLVEAEGRDPSELQVVGTLPVVRTDDGIDLGATMAQVPPLVDAGITDFRAQLRIPDDLDAATEHLAEVVGAFRAAVGRPGVA